MGFGGLPLLDEMMEDCVLLPCNILVHQFARRIMGDFGEYGAMSPVPMLLVLELERMFGVVCLRSN